MKLFYISATLCVATVEAVTLTTTNSRYTVSAESSNSLVVSFNRSSCDITSLLYRGRETQYQKEQSHIGSGLGSANVTAEAITSNGTDYVKVTCTTPTLIHYYVIRNGDSSLHMATWISAEPKVGELRWLFRAKGDVLPDDDVGGASVTFPSTSAVEGKDVFLVGGQTRSKFYSSQRFIDDQVHCLSGLDIKACMIMPGNAYESSSGGPFFRDINMNPTGNASNLYFYMNSGHVQTEANRMGLHGPYSIHFSTGGTPSGNLDLSFLGNLGIQGWVARSERGTVKGTASGIDGSKFRIVVHWYNSEAQYWTYASPSGTFTSPAIKPGTYNQILYQGELKVANSTVTVTAGSTTTANTASTWTTGTEIFRIGEFDGSPSGFRNAAAQLRQHPSDARMASWGPLTYTVGTSSLLDFPMALFRDTNTPLTVNFHAARAGVATLRIATTIPFAGGRPGVVFNRKALPNPPAPKLIDERAVTRGAYRGYGEIYDFSVDVLNGANAFNITVVSGSKINSTTPAFLRSNFIFDAVAVFT